MIYIRSAAVISPQNTLGGNGFATHPVAYTGNKLQAIEPDYKSYIDAKLIRRMSRIIRMGVAAALQCLRNAGVENVDAIVTGTAYGCLEDSHVFLSRLIEQNEEALSPTAFIQSTHNTVGAQIALTLQCTGYNNTFVHRALSFESALLDSIMLLKDGEANTVLTGGIDEITKESFTILNRFGLYKRGQVSNLNLIQSGTKGAIAGEGAGFFLLSGQASGNDLAQLDDIATFYKPANVKETEAKIAAFLQSHRLTAPGIDYIISGRNGDSRYDEIFDALEGGIFKDANIVYYKHLCGEYPASTAFALGMAADIIRQKAVENKEDRQHVLVYNNYQNTHHSLILLSSPQ